MCQTILPSWRWLTLALEQGTLDWAVGNRAWIQQGTLNQWSIHLTYLPYITKKKSEHQRIDAFELWCWRRFLRIPWTVKRSNQSIIKEISFGYSLEGLMLKVILQYFGHLMRRTDSFKIPWCWERLKVGGEGDDRGWDGWIASPTWWTWVWVNSRSWWWTGRRAAVHGLAKSWTRLSNWTDHKINYLGNTSGWDLKSSSLR